MLSLCKSCCGCSSREWRYSSQCGNIDLFIVFVLFIVFQDPRDGVVDLIRRIKNLKLVASKVGKQVFKLLWCFMSKVI